MTSYELISFLEQLPKHGVIEILGDDVGLCLVPSSCTYEAHGDGGLIIRGKTGFGNIATVESTTLIDVDKVAGIRHTKGTDE